MFTVEDKVTSPAFTCSFVKEMKGEGERDALLFYSEGDNNNLVELLCREDPRFRFFASRYLRVFFMCSGRQKFCYIVGARFWCLA